MTIWYVKGEIHQIIIIINGRWVNAGRRERGMKVQSRLKCRGWEVDLIWTPGIWDSWELQAREVRMASITWTTSFPVLEMALGHSSSQSYRGAVETVGALLQKWIGHCLASQVAETWQIQSPPHMLSKWPSCDQPALGLSNLMDPGLGPLLTWPQPGAQHFWEAEGPVGRLFLEPLLLELHSEATDNSTSSETEAPSPGCSWPDSQFSTKTSEVRPSSQTRGHIQGKSPSILEATETQPIDALLSSLSRWELPLCTTFLINDFIVFSPKLSQNRRLRFRKVQWLPKAWELISQRAWMASPAPWLGAQTLQLDHVGSQLIPFICCLVAKSCPTLCEPMDCRLPGSSVHGISQARILQWVATSFCRGSPPPRDRIHVSCIAGVFFTTEPPRKPRPFIY